MNIGFNIEETARQRYSVRTYSNQEVEKEKLERIRSFIESLDNPFGAKVNFHLLDNFDLEENKLGTYGIIKGAKGFIGATIKQEPLALEALGYEFEAVVLYLTSLGLGTCWLGGTFHKKDFTKVMNIPEDELFPIVSPYGYAASRKSITEFAMRTMIRAGSRKDWSLLFYKDNFDTPLTKEEAGYYGMALEAVQAGPSASNKQPWRVLYMERVFHFYEYRDPKYTEIFQYDIQRIDMGICAAHFDLAVKEKGIKGHFDINNNPGVPVSKNMEYVFSWSRE